MISIVEKKVPSSDGIHQLFGKIYRPEGEVRGILQVVHGMNEYIDRYDPFLRAMAQAGILAFGFDNLGHGNTARDRLELGFLAEKDGWKHLLQDVRLFSDAVREEYGNTLPYDLMGHSMGSFIVRCAVLCEVHPRRLIVMGTGGPEPAATAGMLLADGIAKIYGKRHVSPLLKHLIFGDYDKKFKETYPYSWLSVDTENLKKYQNDPFCTFSFTASALGDLIRLNRLANSKDFFRGVSDDLPILLLSGKDDPVGNYGKGVCSVHRRLLKEGKNAKIRLYEGYRHEILNDYCREEVTRDILDFLSAP